MFRCYEHHHNLQNGCRKTTGRTCIIMISDKDSPLSKYQYSNMAPMILGQSLKVSFLSQFPKETWIQRKQHQI